MKNYTAEMERQSLRDLLPPFYEKYGLGKDGGNSSHFVKVEFTKTFFVYFPNFDARRKAVFKHDVHHIATGYTSTFRGETEIGAWEIASGTRHYWVAFILDLNALMVGLLFNPIGVFKAFIKGRQTKNLYTDFYTDEQLMDMPLYQIRESLLLNNYNLRKKKVGLWDLILFLLLVLTGVLYSLFSMLLLPFVLVYTVYVVIKNRK